MSSSPRLPISGRRSGFTLIETIIVLVIISMMAAVIAPKVNSAIGQSRVENSARVIAADLQLAFSLASRNRTPLRITVDASAATYSIVTRAGTVIRERDLGDGSDLHVGTMSSSVATLDVFPSGFASGPITIVIGINGYEQTITMTRAGQVRVTS